MLHQTGKFEFARARVCVHNHIYLYTQYIQVENTEKIGFKEDALNRAKRRDGMQAIAKGMG